MTFDFDLRALIWLGCMVVLVIWGTWELIDWLFIDDTIKTKTPIIPDIEVIIKNGKSDTTYIYRK